MNYLFQGFLKALELIISFDTEVYSIAVRSLGISLIAIILASFVSIILAFVIHDSQFRGKNIVINILNSLLAVPTVVVGLFVFAVLSRHGPLGNLNYLFTVNAIIFGQFLLAVPLITTLIINVLKESEKQIVDTALSLGATKYQAYVLLLKELRYGVFGAIAAGYGRIVSEVGISMIVGGNIHRVTRTLTTAIALETSRGDFAFSIALGVILLFIALVINFAIGHLRVRNFGYK